MAQLQPYCARNAIIEAFLRPAIGFPRCRDANLLSRRTFALCLPYQQKLSRKQREQSGIVTPEDQERIRKAQEKLAERAANKAVTPRRGFRAEELKQALSRDGKVKATTKVEEEQRLPENDEIQEREISLVDREGRYLKRVDTKEVLWSLNRAEEKLMVVKQADEKDPTSVPLCKIYSIAAILQRNLKLKGKAAQREKGEKMSKELELTWTIGPADLDLKCRQIAKFLKEGRKVDVSVARKYRRKEPDRTMDELLGLVERLRDVAKAVEGTREYRQTDGKLAHTMNIYFEGPAGGIQDKIDETEDLLEPGRAGTAA